MRLSFACLSHLLIEEFFQNDKGVGESFCEIAQLIDPDNPSFDWEGSKSGYTDIYNKGRDFSPYVKRQYSILPYEDRKKKIEKIVFCNITDEDRYLLKSFLAQWIEKDETIPSDSVVFSHYGYTKRRLSEPNSIDPLDFLTETFEFALSRSSDAEKYPREEVEADLEKLKKEVTSHVVNPELKTVNDLALSFDKVFVEMKLPFLEGVHQPNEFRAYHLSIQDHSFVMERLKSLLKKNIGNYVFTRMMIDRYMKNQDEASINLDAMEAIRKHKDLSADDIANILLYLFLEHVLKAPKIMSGYELLDSGRFDFTGIHLLNRKDMKGEDFYQLVLGTSCLSGGLELAIKESIDRLGQISRKRSTAIRLVDGIDLNQKFLPSQVAFLKSVLVPEGPDAPLPETGFGLFIGYRPDVTIPDALTREKISSLVKTMEEEIAESIPTIKESIKRNGLADSSVYLYLVPFNDPEKDVGSIFDDFMGRTMV